MAEEGSCLGFWARQQHFCANQLVEGYWYRPTLARLRNNGQPGPVSELADDDECLVGCIRLLSLNSATEATFLFGSQH